MATQFDLHVLAKVAGLTSSGIFTGKCSQRADNTILERQADQLPRGYTWSLSRAGVPAILDHGPDSDDVILPKWRYLYVDGAVFSRPSCLVSLVSFAYLAYSGEFNALWPL